MIVCCTTGDSNVDDYVVLDDEDDDDDDDNDAVVAKGGSSGFSVPKYKEGQFWYPFHWPGFYIEPGTNRQHFTVMIDLPSRVGMKDTKNIRTLLADEGKTLVVMALYPDIMVEDGLEEFYSRWKKSEQGMGSMRMKSGMDKEVNDYKQSVPRGLVMGIFKLALPFVVDPYYTKHWIVNDSKCQLLHVDMAMATLDLERNNIEGFERVSGRDMHEPKKYRACKSLD